VRTFSDLDHLFANGPVRRADHPGLAGTLDRARRKELIVSVLPGVYVPTALRHNPEVLQRAAMLWDPDAVIIGRTAAAASFWPNLKRGPIELASPHRHRVVTQDFRFVERKIPPELIVTTRRIRYSSPALTALDLCLELDGVIDRAFRAKRVTPEQLQTAFRLSPWRDGNGERRGQILDSTGKPWSYLERRTHRLLRANNLHCWQGNPLVVLDGESYHPDVLFDDMSLVLELEGPLHEDPTVHDNDCLRQNDFSIAGYHVLRFTEHHIDNQPDQVMDSIFRKRRALRR